MKRRWMLLSFACAVCCWWSSAAPAAPRRDRMSRTVLRRAAIRRDCTAASQVVVVPGDLVATQYAVRVALPVAPRSWIYYEAESSQPRAIESRRVGGDAAIDSAAAEEKPRGDAAASAAAPTEGLAEAPADDSLVSRHCSSCHARSRPAGDLILEDAAGLAADQRLLAIRRLLDDDPLRRMPKGKALSPAELGEILQELSSKTETSNQGE